MGRGSLDLVEHVLPEGATGAAIVDAAGNTCSYDELRHSVEDGARNLAQQLGEVAGRAICIGCKQPAAYLRAALAVLRAGAILVPINPTTSADVRRSHEQAVGAVATVHSMAITGEMTVDVHEYGVVGLVPGTSVVLPTSGSSGIPKRVQLGADGLIHNIDAIIEYLPVEGFPRTGVVLPLSYSYGLIGQCFTTLRCGGTVVLLGDIGFAAQQVERMRELYVRGLSSVPASLARLAAVIEDLPEADRPQLGYIASAGGPLANTVVSALQRAAPKATLFNQYGLTEASPRVTALSSEEPAFFEGSIGKPISGVEVSIVDDERPCAIGETGELVVHGPSNMLGYVGDASDEGHALSELGLRTGDLGHVDEHGYLYLSGRRDDLVNIAGERVSTKEIARTLECIDGVSAAHVVAKPDDILGYRIVAFVVASDELLSDIRRGARAALTPARRPAKIICLRALPTNANGKLDRKLLRQWAKVERAIAQEKETEA